MRTLALVLLVLATTVALGQEEGRGLQWDHAVTATVYEIGDPFGNVLGDTSELNWPARCLVGENIDCPPEGDPFYCIGLCWYPGQRSDYWPFIFDPVPGQFTYKVRSCAWVIVDPMLPLVYLCSEWTETVDAITGPFFCATGGVEVPCWIGRAIPPQEEASHEPINSGARAGGRRQGRRVAPALQLP